MLIKSVMLVCAFGVAMTIGMVSNNVSVEKENSNSEFIGTDVALNQGTFESKQGSKPKQKNTNNQQIKNLPKTSNVTKKSNPTTEPQKGARLNSVHFGHSHAELASKEACTACHQSNENQLDHYSPYFLGFFSNKGINEKNEVDVAFLGVNASDVPPAVRSHLRLDENNGAIVNHVVDESPAYHCGIEKHDILVAIDHQPISGEKRLLELVRSLSPGTKINIEYVRAGKKESINLVLGKQKTARILRSFQINGCEAQLTSSTNCQSCHAIESK